MEKKYQIFISSTYEDLKDERQKVMDTILEMGHFPIGMEMFSAANEGQWKIIKETIDSTDFYVLIIARRYGSIIEDGVDKGKSYTQKEFEYAVSQNIPVLVFLLDGAVKVTSDKDEIDPNKKMKLDAFVKLATTDRMFKLWTNKDDLATGVSVSLNNQFKRSDRPGYIRGDESNVPCRPNEIKTYSCLSDAFNDIVADIKSSSFFDFMGLQGSNFLAEANQLIDAITDKEDLHVRYLIQYPFSEEIRQRLTSLHKGLHDYEIENHWRSIYENVKKLKSECMLKYPKATSVDMRYFDGPLIHRMIFTEQHLFLNYYEEGKGSRYCKVFRYDSCSPTYETYRFYFQKLWIKARRSLPIQKIPAKYSFLKDQTYQVTPSLVVNICANCDMNCLYCPEGKDGRKIGGENLQYICEADYCDIVSVKQVVEKFGAHIKGDNEKPILRITGGEPLFGEENRKRTLEVLKSAKKDYGRIVFCTNGLSFEKAYQDDVKLWESLKKKLLLKISLDTLNEDKFQLLTGTKKGCLDKVKRAIIFAAKKGFKIEINVVATKENMANIDDILELFYFAVENRLVGIKILTVNDFGGNVEFEQSEVEQTYVTAQLGKLIDELLHRDFEERGVFLNDNKGIRMRRFVYHYNDLVSEQDRECTLTIVDHHSSSHSITPTRTFSEFCKECIHYPLNVKSNSNIKSCATGVMSLTLRADGLLSPCRLLVDPKNAVNITNKRPDSIRKTVDDMLRMYDHCWHGVGKE